MTTYERRQSLLDILRKQPGLRVPELAQLLDVSEGTIRNDLNALESEGKLKRVHGGAALTDQGEFQNNPFIQRYNQNGENKLAIAQKAALLVNDGDSLFIDSSSTVFYLARELSKRNGLRVVTNGFDAARELANNPSNMVILIGGVVNNYTASVTGLLSEHILEEMSIDKTFLSCSGFSLERGMTEILMAEAQIKRKVIESSKQLFALIDSSKFGREDLTPFARPNQIIQLFTDTNITDKWTTRLQEANINFSTC